EALESTRSIDTVVLDKTGTLTTGVMSLAGTELSAPDFEVLARLESRSEHPIARAIVAAAPEIVGATAGTKASDSTPAGSAEITNFENIAGGGLRATIDGADVLAGRPGLLREHGIAVDVSDDSGHRGATIVALAIDGRFRGLSFVADEAKPSAADAIAELHSLGLDTVLLTGDNAQAAEVVAETLGITEVRADVRPDGKVSWSPSSRRGARPWRWSETGSTMPRPWQVPTSASRWVRARTQRWPPRTSPWSSTIRGRSHRPSGSRAEPSASSRATCSGPSPTTRRRFRSRLWACWIR